MSDQQIARAAVGEAFALLWLALVNLASTHLAGCRPAAWRRRVTAWRARVGAWWRYHGPAFYATGFGLVLGLQIGITAARAAGAPL